MKLSRTYSKKIRILYRLNSCNENSGKKLKSILTKIQLNRTESVSIKKLGPIIHYYFNY